MGSQPLLQNRVLVHLYGNGLSSPFARIMLLRRGTHSHIILDQVKQGSLTTSSRKRDCSLERGKKESNDIIDILIFLITIGIIILVSRRG